MVFTHVVFSSAGAASLNADRPLIWVDKLRFGLSNFPIQASGRFGWVVLNLDMDLDYHVFDVAMLFMDLIGTHVLSSLERRVQVAFFYFRFRYHLIQKDKLHLMVWQNSLQFYRLFQLVEC